MEKRPVKRQIRDALYLVLYYSGGFTLLNRIMRVLRREHPCVILAYHRIVDGGVLHMDKGPVMHHRLEDFEKELAFLKRNFDILSLDDVVRQIKIGRGFKRPSVAITFDDGYLDNYHLAYPALRRKGLPAAIYVTTGLVGTSESTWTDKLEKAFLSTTKAVVELGEPLGAGRVSIATREEKEEVCLRIGESLKEVPDETRKDMLKTLLNALGTNGGPSAPDNVRLMLDWDEIREMAAHGITVGSHSHTHPILSRMNQAEAKREISRSKDTLEEKLKTPVKHFAFPNGRPEDFTEALRDHCRAVGFESVASLVLGVNDGRTGDVFDLRRLGAMSPIHVFAGLLMRIIVRTPGNSQAGLVP